MLNKDAKAKNEIDQKQKKTFEETCHISTHISTPRMFKTVLQLLPEGSTRNELQSTLSNS